MIIADQPSCFSDDVRVHVSSRQDGSMRDRTLENMHDAAVVKNREAFCESVGINYSDCVYQIIRYGDDCTYDIIGDVDRPDTDGVWADVLYTEKSGVGLFLPVADCIATVIYDPKRQALALAHLGRHASVAKTMTKTIEFFQSQGSNAEDIIIWMAPSVAQQSYRMQYFDEKNDPDWSSYTKSRDNGVYLDMAGFNRNLAQQCGVKAENMYDSAIDTATNPNYFSHSHGDTKGRFAVVAMMR